LSTERTFPTGLMLGLLLLSSNLMFRCEGRLGGDWRGTELEF